MKQLLPLSYGEIRKQLLTGRPITKKDAARACRFFKQLSSELNQAGPAFLLAAREASRIYLLCNNYLITQFGPH